MWSLEGWSGIVWLLRVIFVLNAMCAQYMRSGEVAWRVLAEILTYAAEQVKVPVSRVNGVDAS